MLKTILTVSFVALGLSIATEAHAISVAVGTARTFKVAGEPPKPGPARRVPIGTALPAPGEITVGLAPAGHAVQVAKLHVYERTGVPIAFKATALHGGKAIAAQTVCGRLDMDAWVTFPAGTQTARLSDFVMAKPGCNPSRM